MASNITERDANSPSGEGRVDQYTEGHPDQAGLSQQQATPAPHTVGYRSTYFGTGTTQDAELTDDASAATALMQLQASERKKSNAHVTDRSEEGPHTQRSAPDMTHFYTHTRLYQSRSDTGPVRHDQTRSYEQYPSYTSQSNTNSQDSMVHDTISNLSNVVSAIQKQQANVISAMQQQHLVIRQEQARITDTLSSLTSMMQQSENGRMQYYRTQQRPTTNTYSGQSNQNMGHVQHDNSEDDMYTAREDQEWGNRGVSHLTDTHSRGFQESRYIEEEQEQRWPENRTLAYTIRDGQYRRRRQLSRTYDYTPSEVKLPPFNGREEWKVWIRRFESVAKRYNWDDETKLDNILPKLQGRAGDFVFDQLSEDTISCYPMLIKELNSRFHSIETEKTFAAKFSQRVQKNDETAEEYAADLKRLYAKAYKGRDSKTRQEDLVRRFLDGLKDNEARFEVEYHKEPTDIDTAVYHVVNFIQTRRRSNFRAYADRKFKMQVRRISQESDAEESDIESFEDEDRCEYVKKLSFKEETPRGKKPSKRNQKMESGPSQLDSKSIMDLITKALGEALTGKIDEMQKNRQDTEYHKKSYSTGNGRSVVCYACGIRGHIAKECPGDGAEQQTRSNESYKPSDQGRTDGKIERKGDSLN